MKVSFDADLVAKQAAKLGLASRPSGRALQRGSQSHPETWRASDADISSRTARAYLRGLPRRSSCPVLPALRMGRRVEHSMVWEESPRLDEIANVPLVAPLSFVDPWIDIVAGYHESVA